MYDVSNILISSFVRTYNSKFVVNINCSSLILGARRCETTEFKSPPFAVGEPTSIGQSWL